MAFNKAPSAWLNGYTLEGHKIGMNTSSAGVPQVEVVKMGQQVESMGWGSTSVVGLSNKWFQMFDPAGSVAVWFNLDTTGSEPSHGCDRAIAVAITTGMSAVQLANAICNALTNDGAYLASVALDENFTITVTHVTPGTRGIITAGDATPPNATVLYRTTASALGGKWFQLGAGAATVAVWFNLDSGNGEPEHGCASSIEVAISSGMTDAQIIGAIASAVNGSDDFNAVHLVDAVDSAIITHVLVGPTTQINDGDSGLTLYVSELSGDVSTAMLDDAKANPSTGDIRKVALGIVEALQTKWDSLATADRPANMTLQKIVLRNSTTESTTVIEYRLAFKASLTGVDILAEA